MAHRGYVVPPLSRAKIRYEAERLRAILGCGNEFVDIVRLLECTIPRMWPAFRLVISPRDEMAGLHAVTTPGEAWMQVREDVYERAHDGAGRDRFTLAHELGHLVLHDRVQFARTWDEDLPVYRDSEWQANVFGAEFLMNYRLMALCQGLEEIVKRFGVTYDAARVQSEQLIKEKLMK